MRLDPQLIPVGLSLIAVFSWGGSDFLGGLATRRVNAFLFTTFVHAAGVLVMGSVVVVTHAPVPSRHAILWAFTSGAIGGVALAIFYRALSLGNMGLTTPVAAVLGAAIPTVLEIAKEGSPGTIPVLGFVVAGLGVWLISRSEGGAARPKGLGLAVLAGIGFAGFYLCVHQAGNESASWIATLSRIASLAVTGAIVLVSGGRQKISRDLVLMAIAAGTLDVTGTVVFLMASQAGRLDAAVVLSSLYPAITVLLARIILKEHFTRWKAVGMIAALAAVPMIAMQ
jgi:uncharacterized membrane protein